MCQGNYPVDPVQFVNFNPVSRNSDLMQLVAEIAAYEDFVDEGNYNVVSASEICAVHGCLMAGNLISPAAFL